MMLSITLVGCNTLSFLPVGKALKGESSLFFDDTQKDEIEDPNVEIDSVKTHDENGEPLPIPTPDIKFDPNKSIEAVREFPWFIVIIPLISGILFIINKIRHHIINRRTKQ